MDIYIDLEATQFGKEIISFGAISESGNEFYSLVRPKNINKITKFITKLTGLRPEMYSDDTPDIQKVIKDFWKWSEEESDDTSISFYSYGNFDRVLLCAEDERYKLSEFKKVIKRLSNLDAVASKVVFGTNESTGLVTIYEKVVGKEIVQNHNALDDARILRAIHQKIKDTDLKFFVEYEKEYATRRYVHRYLKGRARSNKLKRYFNTLCELELNALEYKDIEPYLERDSLNKIARKIKEDIWNLTGKRIEGDVLNG